MHDPSRAIAEFRKITDHPYRYIANLVYPASLVGLARSYAAAGERDKALKAYDEALAIWADADRGLPMVEAARAERAALGK